MAGLFDHEAQAEQYSGSRPTATPELFDFIASNTPSYDLVWDVGTGTGQAAQFLAKTYKRVIATDTSGEQLEMAADLPNIRYKCTPSNLSMEDLQKKISGESSVDLVTVAQAMHWFHLPGFYQQVKWVLKKPNGVIAAWCYSVKPQVSPKVDDLMHKLYHLNAGPYWEPPIRLIEEKYETIDFPFAPVERLGHTGPFEFKSESLMDLDGYLSYVKSWSAYQIAKERGVELLTDDLVRELSLAWNEDGEKKKLVCFPTYLRIGRVGNA